jgi:cell division septation protein DedD
MFQENEDGKEIVLESRQLLGIFFLFAVILGIAFVAGFMVGHGSFDFAKKAPSVTSGDGNTGALTRTVEPPPGTGPGSSAGSGEGASQADTAKPEPRAAAPAERAPAESSKSSPAPAAGTEFKPLPLEDTAGGAGADLYHPQAGQQFWQVTAQSRDKAETVAKSLVHSGFAAHVAPSQDPKLFRVLIGPLKNQSEAASIRTALREKGFNSVMARNY